MDVIFLQTKGLHRGIFVITAQTKIVSPVIGCEHSLREQSFLILGTGEEDFWPGYETFFHYFVGVRKY